MLAEKGEKSWSCVRRLTVKRELNLALEFRAGPELVASIGAIEPDDLLEPFDLSEHLVDKHRHGGSGESRDVLAPKVDFRVLGVAARNVLECRICDAGDCIVVQGKPGETDLYWHDVASYVVLKSTQETDADYSRPVWLPGRPHPLAGTTLPG